MTAPKFNHDDLLNVIETYPPNHPAYIAAMKQMLDSMPEADKERFHKEAMAILGNPEPDGYDVRGQPVFTAETMARCSGIPIDEVESFCAAHEKIYGKVSVDEKVTVLKQPEVEYQISASGVVIIGLQEFTDGNEIAINKLTGWFNLAVSRGLSPIVIEQLKQLIKCQGWDRKAVDRYLNRIYQFSTANEFVIDFMECKPL